VPCYNLPKLHDRIKHELPPCPKGLVQTWKHIAEVMKQQKMDPTYQYKAALPEPRTA